MKEEEGVEGKEEKREGGDGGGTEEKTKVNDERVEKKPKALEKEEREVKMEGKEMKEEEEDKDVVEKKRKRYLRVSGGKDKDSRCQVRKECRRSRRQESEDCSSLKQTSRQSGWHSMMALPAQKSEAHLASLMT
ncbi:hypothetical protein M8J76_008066 [Diaphorina citri]|nr:hypothetical protein M8J76_008066 [Diaphorina citri]